MGIVTGSCDLCEKERELQRVYSPVMGELWVCHQCLGEEPEEEEEE